jgi:hypothetical protein
MSRERDARRPMITVSFSIAIEATVKFLFFSRRLEKEQLGVFLQIFNVLRKKGETNFKIGGIGYEFVFI